MTDMSTPTPRTDKALWKNEGCGPDELCDAEHAKELETELAAALEREKALREALEKAEQAMSTCMDHCYSDGMVHHQSFHTSAIGTAILESRQALALCTEGKTNTHAEQVEALQQEIEILRQYGNKDCTAMADERLEELRKDGKQ